MIRPAAGPVPPFGHWATPRPLAPAIPTHVHGAMDITAPVNTPTVWPEDGFAYGFAVFRQESRKIEIWRDRLVNCREDSFPWPQYVYDVYGGVLVLKGDSGAVHLMCHHYMRQMFYSSALPPEAWEYQEDGADTPFPMTMWHTFSTPHRVKAGEAACRIGNAGQSTGSHLHWEMHNGWEWTPFNKRPDPEKIVGG